MFGLRLLFGGFLLLAMVGCAPDPKSGSGFTLPEGNAERGRATFVALQCTACHTVAGVEFAMSESDHQSESIDPVEPDDQATAIVRLGGEKGHVVTYGDLVTGIINPSHRFALGYTAEEIKDGEQSKMRLYNDEMTVTELTDLVTFLQQHYKVRVYQPTPYIPYY